MTLKSIYLKQILLEIPYLSFQILGLSQGDPSWSKNVGFWLKASITGKAQFWFYLHRDGSKMKKGFQRLKVSNPLHIGNNLHQSKNNQLSKRRVSNSNSPKNKILGTIMPMFQKRFLNQRTSVATNLRKTWFNPFIQMLLILNWTDFY